MQDTSGKINTGTSVLAAIKRESTPTKRPFTSTEGLSKEDWGPPRVTIRQQNLTSPCTPAFPCSALLIAAGQVWHLLVSIGGGDKHV